MKTVLITGGAGFIGSALARHIYKEYPEWRIIILDCLTYAASIDNLPVSPSDTSDRFEFVYGDIRNASLVDMLVSQCDYVVHLAAETHVTRSIYDNSLFFDTDVLGTQTICTSIVKHQKSVERFVHTSSSEVYGTAVSANMDEDHPLNPMSPYAAAKVGADRLVYSYEKTYGLPSVIIRPFNNYGTNQHMEKVIPRFITAILMGENLRIHGDGEAARDYVHAEDTSRAIMMALLAPHEKVVGEVFNIGSEIHRSIKSLALDITSKMGVPYEENIENIAERPGQVFRHTASTAKIREVLGWAPEIEWDDGLAGIIAWYKDNRDWWDRQLWMRTVPIITQAGEHIKH